MLGLVRSFSYTTDTSFSEEVLLHSSGQRLVMNFSYTPDASFSEEVFVHSSGHAWRGGFLILLELVPMRSFSYTRQAMFSEEFLLHS